MQHEASVFYSDMVLRSWRGDAAHLANQASATFFPDCIAATLFSFESSWHGRKAFRTNFGKHSLAPEGAVQTNIVVDSMFGREISATNAIVKFFNRYQQLNWTFRVHNTIGCASVYPASHSDRMQHAFRHQEKMLLLCKICFSLLQLDPDATFVDVIVDIFKHSIILAAVVVTTKHLSQDFKTNSTMSSTSLSCSANLWLYAASLNLDPDFEVLSLRVGISARFIPEKCGQQLLMNRFPPVGKITALARTVSRRNASRSCAIINGRHWISFSPKLFLVYALLSVLGVGNRTSQTAPVPNRKSVFQMKFFSHYLHTATYHFLMIFLSMVMPSVCMETGQTYIDSGSMNCAFVTSIAYFNSSYLPTWINSVCARPMYDSTECMGAFDKIQQHVGTVISRNCVDILCLCFLSLLLVAWSKRRFQRCSGHKWFRLKFTSKPKLILCPLFVLILLTMLTNVEMQGLSNEHSCAALINGSVRCWGLNAFGQVDM
jgi:hypothetical protein